MCCLFFLLINTGTQISRLSILIEGQIPFLAVSVIIVLILISEVMVETT